MSRKIVRCWYCGTRMQQNKAFKGIQKRVICRLCKKKIKGTKKE